MRSDSTKGVAGIPKSSEKNEGQHREPKTQNIIILVIAAAVAASLATYLYEDYTADAIQSNAVREIQNSATVQANDVGKILANKVESIKSNLIFLGNSKRVQDQDLSSPLPFSAIQESTSEFTDSYLWLDRDGRLLWSSSFQNQTLLQQFAGADRSDREYYLIPKVIRGFHITSSIESVDGNPRIFISYPVFDGQSSPPQFKGVIVAAANLAKVGQYLKSQLTEDSQNSVGLLSKDGTILYAPDERNIGLNVLGDQFLQSSLPEEYRASFAAIITKSLGAQTAGFDSLGPDSNSATLAYQPITIDGSKFAVLYVIAPHNLAASTTSLLANQRLFSIILIVAIAGISIGTAVAISRWNKKLAVIVTTRTADLKTRTKELEDANASLEVANSQLKVHDKLQREFVNVAAHELRTPIQPLLGAAELMETQFGDKEKIEVSKAEVEMIVRNAKRLERLSSDILAISRIESGALKLNRETFSLSYLVAEAVKDAKARVAHDSSAVKISFHPDDIFINADREKITQVVSNLIANSIKFTQEGTITVMTRRDATTNQAIVTITDSGQGIDQEVLPKLFTKFVTKSNNGTGIGLYISKKIIEAHGGKLSGRNNPEGRGATFSFSLPIQHEGDDEIETPLGSPSAKSDA